MFRIGQNIIAKIVNGLIDVLPFRFIVFISSSVKSFLISLHSAYTAPIIDKDVSITFQIIYTMLEHIALDNERHQTVN
jgi:hypothetical protein